MNNTTYPERNAKPPSEESEHYKFFIALKEGKEILRDDKLNNIREMLTLDHSGIQGNPANITYYGYKNLSIVN